MKTYSKEELEKKALKIFKQFPNANKVYATADGNVFLDKNRANLHTKGQIFEIERAHKSDANLSVKDAKTMIEEIAKIDKIEELDLIQSSEKRKTVLEAIEKRREQLQELTDSN